MAVIQEIGHALYEDGRPAQWLGQPVGNSRGMTLHESQSLLLEMQAARSEEFIRFILPTIKRLLDGSGSDGGSAVVCSCATGKQRYNAGVRQGRYHTTV